MSATAAARPVRTLGTALVRNIRAGVRLALFRHVRGLDYRASFGDYATLVAFNLLVWLAGAFLRTSGEVRLDPVAIAVYVGLVPVVLLATALLARLYRNPALTLLLAVALSASDLLMEAAGVLVSAVPPGGAVQLIVNVLFVAWVWVVTLRAVAVCTGARGSRLLPGALGATALAVFVLFAYPKSEPWVAPRDAPAASPALAGEALFHLQGTLIERHLDALESGREGVPELYFAGFAPDGSQDVFLREMRFVQTLFAQRFGASARSIALVSGDGALREYPVATATNLARALARIGERMNADEDVLFLFVSAHGDRNFVLSAWQPPLEQRPLNPTSLARMLQDSGIKWKVIVISACYAGGFIEPLRDPHTMVIAAAAPDRQSFGCENGRDFTYFGEAFFKDGLAQTDTFAAAFERAKERVAQREIAEQKTPSQPQIWIGERIAERLRAIEESKPGVSKPR